MVDFNMNDLADRCQVLDSFVQLKSGADRYRLKSLQAIDPLFQWPQLVRVSDDGVPYFNDQVPDHRVSMLLRLTADEFDTANPPTNTRTISYFVYQKNLRQKVNIAVSVVYVSKATTNPFLRCDFTFELETVGMPRILEDGDVGLPITGRIYLTSTITLIRGAS